MYWSWVLICTVYYSQTTTYLVDHGNGLGNWHQIRAYRRQISNQGDGRYIVVKGNRTCVYTLKKGTACGCLGLFSISQSRHCCSKAHAPETAAGAEGVNSSCMTDAERGSSLAPGGFGSLITFAEVGPALSLVITPPGGRGSPSRLHPRWILGPGWPSSRARSGDVLGIG